MIKVGLTGNICSGYDTVASLFKGAGVPVFDADIAIKFLLNYREDITRDIKIQFGDVYHRGAINPNKFANTEKFNRLLKVVELELLKIYESWRLFNKNAAYTIFKCGILFESGLDKSMNYTISTFMSKDERARILSNTGIKMSDSYDIINSEMDELMKNQRSEWIIHNYSNANLPLIAQVKDINTKIEAKSIKKVFDLIKFPEPNDNFDYSKNIFT
jgi:dephospho-CoA kinase